MLCRRKCSAHRAVPPLTIIFLLFITRLIFIVIFKFYCLVYMVFDSFVYVKILIAPC